MDNADLHLLYTIITVLFALSMIAERISNMFKLLSKDLKLKQLSAALEKQREKYILLVALGTGIMVAGMAGADFFTLVNTGKLLNYSSVPVEDIPKVIIGIILTGAFASLGSKFWHDMLDIVLQVSNLKQAQVTQTQQTNNQGQLDELAKKVAIILPKLNALPNYAGYSVSVQNNQPSVVFKFAGTVPPFDQTFYNKFFLHVPINYIAI